DSALGKVVPRMEFVPYQFGRKLILYVRQLPDIFPNYLIEELSLNCQRLDYVKIILYQL
ncbi:hypothetical protein MKW92_038668, partial [Papaver armeniacum]